MNQDAQLALQLLENIHDYYPIGFPHMRDEYPGFKKLLEIQKAKTKKVTEDSPENWDRLMDELSRDWGEERIFSLAGTPFPCYQSKIFVANEMRPGLKKSTGISLCVSLLVDHYGVFVTDDYDFITYRGDLHITSHKIISSGYDHPLIGTKDIDILKHKIERHFPGHSFVNHRVLFNYRIFGAFGMAGSFENLDQSVIYDYLFGGDMVGFKYSVAP